jgi:hypothetical protein
MRSGALQQSLEGLLITGRLKEYIRERNMARARSFKIFVRFLLADILIAVYYIEKNIL